MHTAVFAVVDAVVLRPLPYPEPDRLVAFASWETAHGAPRPDALSYPNFFDFRAGNRVFEHLVCYRDDQFAVSLKSGAIHVDGGIVSWDLFDALRVAPALCRGFLPEEEKPGAHVAVLGHELWPTQFGADPSVVGLTVPINGKPYTMVGIAPADFVFPENAPPVQLWTSLALAAEYNEYNEGSEFHPLTVQRLRGACTLDVIGRLRNGVTIDAARAQMDAIAASIVAQYPEEKTRASTYIRPELERVIGETEKPMLMLLGAVFLVLLIRYVRTSAVKVTGSQTKSAVAAGRPRHFAATAPDASYTAPRNCLGVNGLMNIGKVSDGISASAALGVAIQELQWHGHVLPAFPAAEVKPPSISRLST